VKFGPVPVADAEGAILAHGLAVGRTSLKKGRVLSAADVATLREAGLREVIAARLEPGDVPEDQAARRLADAAAGPGARVAAAFTGRANLYADEAGIALVDRERIDAVNLLDEALTVATVAPYDVVTPRQMLATVKVIPFAAPEAVVAEAERLARDAPLVAVAPFRPKRVGLVLTTLPATKPSVLDKTEAALAARLEPMGSIVVARERVPHDEAALAAAILRMRDAGANPILIFGASAIVDRRDVIPAAIVAAGGTVEHFGMPVDPGNLLLLGRLRDVPVVGLPGCARSPKINGFDWVLQRLLADVPVTRRDIQLMGAGGLLKEIATRPQPREGDGPAPAPHAPRIAALVLAAGQSRRMGGPNKLLEEVDGKPLVAHAVDTARAADVVGIVVVTGHERGRVESALAGREVRLVHNPDFAEGLSTSLKAGLQALPADADGAIVCLGDMPRLKPTHLDRLIAAFNPVEGRTICVPTFRHKRGNPVLWGRRFFAEMQAVAGDVGARHLIGEHADQVAEVEMDDAAVLLDVDTPEALAALKADPR
jgi:molybdenum cofactor cytidylyltransferase